jgi:deoxyribonuclease-4
MSKLIGYHIPKNKTFKESIEEPYKISNINAFQIFVRNPRQLKIVEYKEKEAEECKKYVIEKNLFLVSHATYLLNSATRDNWENKIESALNDLIYSEKIGAIGSVFHVGKYLKQSVEEGIENMFEFISTVIQRLQEINSKSIYILETCASCGTELLADLKDFGDFYHRFNEKYKENLKICIDTCHVFSAGYSLKSRLDSVLFIDYVEENIGWNNVVLIHLNDSKKDTGCHVDRHENLCKGCIGKDSDAGFKYFVNYCVSKNIPLILETPHNNYDMYEIYNEELKKIYGWIDN